MSIFENGKNSIKHFYLWGEHKVSLDFDDDLDVHFKQKALEELRESPDEVERGLKSLKELLEGDICVNKFFSIR